MFCSLELTAQQQRTGSCEDHVDHVDHGPWRNRCWRAERRERRLVSGCRLPDRRGRQTESLLADNSIDLRPRQSCPARIRVRGEAFRQAGLLRIPVFHFVISIILVAFFEELDESARPRRRSPH